MEMARNIVYILKAFTTVRKYVIASQSTQERPKDVLSNTKLNDTKTINCSPENHLFYFADNSNSICENCKRFIS